MESPTAIRPGDRMLVTGAAGFIGSAVTRALLARDAEVVALLQPGVPSVNLDGLVVEPVVADLRDAAAVAAAATGCRMVFHVAAVYRFWAPNAADFYDVNVGGSLNVIDAAKAAGVERVVYTSTVGTIGLDGTENGGAADGQDDSRFLERPHPWLVRHSAERGRRRRRRHRAPARGRARCPRT